MQSPVDLGLMHCHGVIHHHVLPLLSPVDVLPLVSVYVLLTPKVLMYASASAETWHTAGWGRRDGPIC